METLRETCQEYYKRRLSEGWRCIEYDYPHAVLMSPWGHKRKLDLRNDVITLRPHAAGDEENLDHVVGYGAGSHYAAVKEIIADDETSWVGTMNANYLRDLYNLENPGVDTGTINKVTVYARCYGQKPGGEGAP